MVGPSTNFHFPEFAAGKALIWASGRAVEELADLNAWLPMPGCSQNAAEAGALVMSCRPFCQLPPAMALKAPSPSKEKGFAST